jgi:hypothetical protein
MAERLPSLEAVALINGPVTDEAHWQARYRNRPTAWHVRRALKPASWRRFIGDPGLRKRYLRSLRARVPRLAGTLNGGNGAAGDHDAKALGEAVQGLIRRRVPVLLTYGTADDFYPDFQHALQGWLGRILQAADGLVRVRTLAADYPLQSSAALQEALIETIDEWFSSAAG